MASNLQITEPTAHTDHLARSAFYPSLLGQLNGHCHHSTANFCSNFRLATLPQTLSIYVTCDVPRLYWLIDAGRDQVTDSQPRRACLLLLHQSSHGGASSRHLLALEGVLCMACLVQLAASVVVGADGQQHVGGSALCGVTALSLSACADPRATSQQRACSADTTQRYTAPASQVPGDAASQDQCAPFRF